MSSTPPTGDELLAALAALANPHRLRIVAALAGKRNYVSQLARELQMSRPLLHIHAQRLEEAGIIRATLELSKDGKAMKYLELTSFEIVLSAASIAAAVPTLGTDTKEKK
ncbi:ArsR/SmtB family transcription factor [Actinomadura rupiterrae]|uniref:ArsR/SmtB family transcription factor n=1 Tax=Actinomadura rupiterrae TaxID=559627 RepID=UPI0020A503E4|nr:winged helix-turn-helix domain-containing protein [Actinomadura rupiterrae]MCP2337598.1 ArsR family transcriptional regulator [Actinomadura rupiterrae]